jgi:hypothetical protein
MTTGQFPPTWTIMSARDPSSSVTKTAKRSAISISTMSRRCETAGRAIFTQCWLTMLPVVLILRERHSIFCRSGARCPIIGRGLQPHDRAGSPIGRARLQGARAPRLWLQAGKDSVDTRALQALGHRNFQNTTRYTALAPERFKGSSVAELPKQYW